MSIDKSKLIELLVSKTGLKEEQVEEQLSLLILRIQQAARQGKDFQIQGFGTFSIIDDALHFQPSRGLETEINHKYAGMKPIELIGAFKDMPPSEEETSGTGAEVDIPADVDSGSGNDTGNDAEINIDIPIQDDSSQKRQRSIEEILGIGQTSAQPKETEESVEPEPVPVAEHSEQNKEEETDASPFGLNEESETDSDTDDPFDFDEESIFGPADEPEEPKEKDPIGTVLTIFVVLLTIAVAAWSVYELDLLNFSDSDTSSSVQPDRVENPVQTASQQEEEATEDAGNLAAVEVPAAGEEGNEPASEEPDEPESIQTESQGNENNISDSTSVYGLMGAAHAEGNNGYTIVVHSLRDRNVAQRQQDGLASEGYRVILTEAMVNGETFWRVSLGQFETLSDAMNAASSLPEPYKDNNFIKRIQ